MPLTLLIGGLPDERRADALLAELERYPTSRGSGGVTGFRAYLPPGAPPQPGAATSIMTTLAPTGETLPVFVWPGVKHWRGVPCPELQQIAPHYRGEERLLLPQLDDRDFVSPLMLWWLLLFGLSSVARYDPELWV